MRKRRRGRPPLAPGAKRTRGKALRFTPAEAALVEWAAAQRGLDVGAWGRLELLKAARRQKAGAERRAAREPGES